MPLNFPLRGTALFLLRRPLRSIRTGDAVSRPIPHAVYIVKPALIAPFPEVPTFSLHISQHATTLSPVRPLLPRRCQACLGPYGRRTRP